MSFSVDKIKSGRIESPANREGKRTVGKSTYKEQFGRTDSLLPMKLRHVSCLQIYLAEDTDNTEDIKYKMRIQKKV